MMKTYSEPHNYPRKPWVIPALTKHNLKENTLGSNGSCIDGSGQGGMFQVGGGGQEGCGPNQGNN